MLVDVAAPLSFITSALAPAISLSVCALLASNAQNQYSALVDRLRLLNAEKREHELAEPADERLALRIKSLDHQIPVLFRRTRHMRNAILALFFGMMAILLTSFLIVLVELTRWEPLATGSKVSFILGLVCIFWALCEKLQELFLTFRVVRYELGLFDPEAAREAERAFRGY